MNVRYVRWAILGIILIGSMILNYLHITAGAAFPSVHAICPLGGLENLQIWLSGHANLQKLFSGTMTLLFLSLGITIIFGRAICGNICPFGAIFEFIGKLTPKKLSISAHSDRVLRYVKYIILAIVIGMAWITATLWVSPYDPYVAYAHIWSGAEILNENGIGLLILLVVLAVSLVIGRFFCKYLCPAGALFGIFSLVSPTRVTRSECMECGKCARSCPMGIEPGRKTAVNASECIGCTTCVDVCPSKTPVIRMTIAGKTAKPLLFVLGTVCIFFGAIALLNTVGFLQVTVPPIGSIQQGGAPLNIMDLRGSMTIEEGAVYAGMDLAEFYRVMEIPKTVPATTPLNKVADYVPGYDFHAIKAK
ncbi:MAG: 4Fe-4S binding protein [Methanomicrobiales archaeon]